MKFFSRKQYRGGEIDPDEIFLDSRNLPEFDTHQFEGRIERPISKRALLIVGLFFAMVLSAYLWHMYELQVKGGERFRALAENNRLEHTIIFTQRGVIMDRNSSLLAWNEPFSKASASARVGEATATTSREKIFEASEERPFAARKYIQKEGFGHLLGFVQYPKKDANGFYFQEMIEGKEGVEQYYDQLLSGRNGLELVEKNALGKIESHNVLEPPLEGENVVLTIDARIQEKLFSLIRDLAGEKDFKGGAGVILEVHTGEVLTLVSFPEYNSQVLSFGRPDEMIDTYRLDERKPFLNRAISGLYSPGSVIKPIVGIAALEEEVITPEKKILSTGSISIPHPYVPGEESVFYDWKAHGLVDLIDAIAYSSNVYFYEVGGGYENQKGLGIQRIAHYLTRFGLGEETGIDLYGEEQGTIPTPEWKRATFDDVWRLGDTYHTAIGQYGFQVTPLQMVRSIASIANGGILVTPRLFRGVEDNTKRGEAKGAFWLTVPSKESKEDTGIREYSLNAVKEGMRAAVEYGTASGLRTKNLSLAAKTGTAQTGTRGRVNSWIVGFFPYEKPRYSFAVVMEHGPEENLVGGVYIMKNLLDWMQKETPEYMSPRAGF